MVRSEARRRVWHLTPRAVRETFKKMYAEPMILPLDANGRIYAIQDEKGNTIGTGTREVCEVLLYIITKPGAQSISVRANGPSGQKPNVRAAISI